MLIFHKAAKNISKIKTIFKMINSRKFKINKFVIMKKFQAPKAYKNQQVIKRKQN